jgi:hypothetical protein
LGDAAGDALNRVWTTSYLICVQVSVTELLGDAKCSPNSKVLSLEKSETT